MCWLAASLLTKCVEFGWQVGAAVRLDVSDDAWQVLVPAQRPVDDKQVIIDWFTGNCLIGNCDCGE